MTDFTIDEDEKSRAIDAIELSEDGVERLPLSVFTESAYLNYSMYVIMDRALPFIGDGLKPVQRRIIYAMSELGLNATAKYKKSARTVGDVLGKYHPHGDSACYEAMVLMAQPFSYRYPLVDGQGNWGAPDDPKSFAAMRYTESRLSKYADLLLSELGQGTVSWQPNFDGSLDEPKTLPARLPNILLNGTTGIAVGMATDIPPHNLKEVTQAAIHLLDNPNATLDKVMNFVQAPDYPTDAEIITPRVEIRKIYETGKGSIRLRAKWHKEDGCAIITGLPHQVSGAKVLEQIAGQMNAKKLPLVEDLRDESDHEHPTRLVVVPRSNRVDLDMVMQHLFATTDLERSYRVNMNMIGLDNRPSVKGLMTILNEWLSFRRETVRSRLQHRLNKVQQRLHILEALLVAFLDIEAVIEIIRHEDDPKSILMTRFELSEIQADAILEIRLRHLMKLEEVKIRGEQAELETERTELSRILGSETELSLLIKKELQTDSKKFGDERRSAIVEREEAKAFSEAELIPVESVTVVLSEMGWIRSAKGHDIDPTSLSYRAGDKFLHAARGKSNQPAVLLDSGGRSYTLDVNALPSARGQGEPVTGKVNVSDGAKIEHLLMAMEEQKFVIASDAGYGFICQFSDFITRTKNGKHLISLPENAKVIAPILIENPEHLLLAITKAGRMLLFPVSQLPELAKGKGNQIVSINSTAAKNGEDGILHLHLVPAGTELTFHSGKRKVVMRHEDVLSYQSDRGRKGMVLPRGVHPFEQLEVHIPKYTF